MKHYTAMLTTLVSGICLPVATSAAPTPPKIAWELSEGIESPESAYLDPESGFIFLSQIGKGGGAGKDGDGWISKLMPDGKVIKNKWVTGLNAPKGLRSHGGRLWVTDIDRIVGIDIAKAKIIETIKVPNAKFLNDLACDGEGAVYAADMIASKIYKYHGGKLSVFADGEEIESPNGLLVDEDRLLVAAWGFTTDFSTKTPGRLFSLDLKTKKKTLITAKPTGNLDGLELDGSGGYVVTDWVAGKVFHITADGATRIVMTLPKGTADHAYLPDKQLLILPRMLENKVTAYRLALGKVKTADKTPQKMLVYFGTYTRGESKGIYVYEMDYASGKLKPLSVTESDNPSFLAIHPTGRYLYAVNEIGNYQGEKAGAVSAFAIDAASGHLSLLNQESSKGATPCHLVVDRAGRNVLVANYGGGSVASLPVAIGGSLGPASSFVQHKGSSVNPNRQEGPHGHSINLDPSGRFAFAADLGLDKVLIYKFAANGKLTGNEPAFAKVKPGAGPRHFAFHPSGQFAYVINELQRTVTAFAFDAKAGALTTLQTITTVPDDVTSGSTAEVQVHPSGKFLYGSNRGHDSIAIYMIDQKTGKLTALGQQKTLGKTPRNFGIDPTGKYLLAANQSTNNVVVFRINQDTGALKPTGTVVEVPTPVCVKFLPR
jgi:6-phosphogluconolactonase